MYQQVLYIIFLAIFINKLTNILGLPTKLLIPVEDPFLWNSTQTQIIPSQSLAKVYPYLTVCVLDAGNNKASIPQH